MDGAWDMPAAIITTARQKEPSRTLISYRRKRLRSGNRPNQSRRASADKVSSPAAAAAIHRLSRPQLR
jgi:hypothetical protein